MTTDTIIHIGDPGGPKVECDTSMRKKLSATYPESVLADESIRDDEDMIAMYFNNCVELVESGEMTADQEFFLRYEINRLNHLCNIGSIQSIRYRKKFGVVLNELAKPRTTREFRQCYVSATVALLFFDDVVESFITRTMLREHIEQFSKYIPGQEKTPMSTPSA